MNCAHAIGTVKKCLSWFKNGDINPKDKISFRRGFRVNNDSIRDLANNNPRITTENIVDRLNVNNVIAIAFSHLNTLGCTSKFDVSEIGHELVQSLKFNWQFTLISIGI